MDVLEKTLIPVFDEISILSSVIHTIHVSLYFDV